MAIPMNENNRSTWAELLGAAGQGALRLSLLFGSAAIALTVVLAPIAEKQVARSTIAQNSIDQISTASTRKNGKTTGVNTNFIIRKSVLQTDSNDICIISADGTRTGTC
jgi:hypothetical protein